MGRGKYGRGVKDQNVFVEKSECVTVGPFPFIQLKAYSRWLEVKILNKGIIDHIIISAEQVIIGINNINSLVLWNIIY